MMFYSGQKKKISSSSRGTLILEAIALFGLGLAFMVEYWVDDAGSPPLSAIVGAVCLFVAVCTGIVAAFMLVVNILKDRIDTGTIIAVLPFLGFTAWGVWYSYTDSTWVRNRVLYWGLLGAVVLLLLYIIARYAKRKGAS